MFSFDTYFLFVGTAFVLVLSPGPDTLLILSRTMASGRFAGFMTLLGTQSGNLVHALLAGFGVSAVILLFPVVFDVLKYAGAAYLIVLAVQAWRASGALTLAHLSSQGGPWRFFRQGLTNNLVNPKMIPFFVALFPSFIDSSRGSAAMQSLVLGGTLALMALVWIGALVFAASRFRSFFLSNPSFLKAAHRLAAITFAGLALRLVAQDRV